MNDRIGEKDMEENVLLEEVDCKGCEYYNHEEGNCDYMSCNGLEDDCTEPLPCE